MGPEGYLIPSEDIAPEQPGMCIIGFQPSPDVSSGAYQIFLLGDTFLRNFYSVFDYDNQEVGLAVNISSKEWAKIEIATVPLISYSIVMGTTYLICFAFYIFITKRDTKNVVADIL